MDETMLDSDTPAPQEAALASASKPPLLWFNLAAIAAMVVGGFGPWVSVGALQNAGTRGDGWFLIVGGIVAAVLLAWDVQSRSSKLLAPSLAGVIGLGCVVVSIVDLEHVLNLISQCRAAGGVAASLCNLASPGWGIYAALIGSVGLAVCSWVALRSRPYAT